MANQREVKTIDYENDKVECNLCHRWMKIRDYDIHYEKCMDIEYLVSVAKQKGENFDRQDLENCRKEVIDKLLKKYPPTKLESVENLWKK